MNTFKRVLSCFMAVLIVCTFFSPVSATAADVTDSVATISSGSSAITTISLGVGSNETERNITWQSNIAEAGKVQYAKKSADAFPALYKEVQAVSKSATNSTNYVNKATIDGLEPSTEYVYRIVVGENVSPVYSFKTDSKGDFSFLFVGDPQIGGSGSANSEADFKNWETTLNAAVAAFPNSNLLVSAGDQVNVATNEEQYAYYFAPAVMQSLTNATVIGNHDTGSIAYSEHFNNPNIVSSDNKTYGATTAGSDYWYTYNHTLFLNLNTNNLSTAEHIAFMENAIAENPNVRWKIAVFHHALYGATYHALEDNVKQLRNTLAPAFMDLGIDVVLTGHEHVYTRSYMMDGLTPDTSNGVQSSVTDPSGILYITANSSTGSKYYDIYTGAAFEYAAVINQEKVPTFSNVEISANTFKITTYRVSDLSVVDSFEINKQTAAPEIVSQQLVLGDNLNMRFRVKADSKYDAINVTVGSGESEKVSLATAQQDADGNYIINVSLAAAQMTDVITLQPVAGSVTGTAKQYTVRQYAEVILKGGYAEPVKNLAQAMLNYGAGAQVYFDYNNTAEQLANKGYENDAVVTLPEELAIVNEGATEGVRFYGASLSFRDRIALRYYFTGDISSMTVNAGEKAYTVGQKDGLSYVELADINPQDYATVYTVTVGEGENPLSVGYSAMHYISRMGTRGSEDLVNLLKALLAYHGAAISYLEWLATCDNLADFIVVYGDNATDNEKTARDMIVEYIQKSTGVKLPIIPASEAEYTADAKYLVIGDTGLGGFAPVADLGLRGYQIKSMGNSVFVCGGTDLGTLSGAVGFLEKVIGLDAYGHQTVNYNKQSEILIDNFDLSVVPDVGMEQPPFSMVSGSAWNQALWGVGQKMFSTIEGSSNHWHNSFDFLPPSEYLDSHPEYYVTEGYLWNKKAVQLSYTANGDSEAFDEMTTICADKIISSAKNNPSMKAVTLTMEDNTSWDSSNAANGLYNKYGTHSAEVIIFMNAVADKVKAGLGDRELDIYFFAYFNTYKAPVKEVDGKLVAIDSDVEMRDNVGVMYAPINGDFLADDFTATTMYEELSGWAALTDNIAVWTYQTNFDNYFNFYNSFNIMPSLYQAMADFSTDYSYNQGQWNNPNSTGFSHLKTYLTGKLSWNADADFEALLDNYFAARFGSAADEMRTLFDSMRAYYDKLQDTYGISGGINQSGEYLRTDRFEKAEIEKWLGYLDAAYAKADNDTIKGYITLESLAVRYLMLELYADTMSTNECMVMMQAFKQDCAAQNIAMFSEGKAIDYLWEQWDSGSIQEIEGIYYNFDLSLGLTSYEIPVPASVGTITAVYDNSYIALDGVSIGANSITFSSEAVNALLNGKSYGDFALYLTTAEQIYKVNVAVVTQMIDSYDDLVAIKANQAGNVLDGYYALANDIDATGEDAICLIDFDGHVNNPENSGVGFKGIFDGRGYTISNLTTKTGDYAKIGGLFGQVLQNAVIRDIAFMDITTDHVYKYTYLLTGESCRMMGKIENVVISAKGDVNQVFGILGSDTANTNNAVRFNMNNVVVSGVDYMAHTIKNANVFENIIIVSDEGVVKQMSASTEDENATNSIIRYSTNEELFAALNTENVIADWENSDIAYENTAIKFNGKAIITELMNIAETEAVIGGSTNLTVQGSVTLSLKEAVDGVSISGNTLTVASNVKTGTKVTVVATSTVSGVTKEFVITLLRTYTDADLGAIDIEIGAESASMAASGIDGNAECLIYGTTTVYEGYAIADGVLTISKDLLDAMYTKLGLGEHTIYLGTDASVRYAITLTIATKIINTQADLLAISTTDSTLYGYYVLGSDIECDGTTVIRLVNNDTQANNNVGFFGTFDGRGHIISNLHTSCTAYNGMGGLFGMINTGAVVKNVAFVNMSVEGTYPFLLSGESRPLMGTLENVAVVGNDSKARVVSALSGTSGKIENCFFANIEEISFGGDKAVVNHVLSATALGRNPDTNGPWGGFGWSGNATYNAQPNYKTVNDMIIALSADNVIADWTDALFTYADGQILYNGKLLVQYDLDLQGADTIYRGTSQTYLSANMIDLMLKEEIDGVSVELTETDDENGIDIFTLTVDTSVPVDTEIVLVAYSYEFESVTKEIVVTVQKQYTDIDLTSQGNMADVQVTDAATVTVPFVVEAIAYGNSGMVTEGVSYADGKLSLTKAAIDAIVAEVGLGEKTLKLYTTDDKCYAVTVTFATKLISNLSDLKSIATKGDTLDGYYVLTNDIVCDSTTFSLVAGWNNKLTTGFVGTFDGRGHIIDGYNGGDTGLFYCTGAKAVIKNIAFTNATGSRVLASTQIHGTTFENVFVSGSAQYFTANGFSAPKYKNVIFVSSHPNAALFIEGNNNNNNGTMTLTNVFVVGEKIHGYYGGTMNEVNAVVYANMDALLTAISAEGELDKWAGSSFSYEDGKLLFAGKVVYQTPVSLSGPEVIIRGTSETYVSDGIITLKTPIDGVSIENGVLSVANTVPENTIITLVATHKDYSTITAELNVQVTKVYEQIDWTALGSIGDLETADANSYIQLPADMNGNVIGVSYGENGMNSDVSVTDGVLSVPKAWVTEVYNAYGYTEQSIKLYTDADKCYTVKVAIVTKAIGTFEELESIAVTGNTLDGYFVLTNDIYCEGKHVHLVGSWTNTKTTGFIGTFDGRGHIIDGFNGESNRGLFYCTGAGVIKNVAFTNATGTVVLANGEIHGTTFENIFVSGSARYLVANAWHSPTFKNVVFNSTFDGGDGRIYNEGNFGTLTINNLLVVGTRTHGYWGGTSNVTNANAVGDTTALITALSAEGELDKWAGSSFSVADGKLLFGGKPVCQVSVSLSGPEVIVRGTSETYTSNGIISLKNPINGVSVENGVLTVAYTVPVDTVITLVATHSKYPTITTEMNVQVSMVYEEIDLTDLGSIGDLETADSYSYIELPDEIVGNVTGISYGDTAKYTNISVTDGELVIPKAWVTEVYNAYGYTEQSIKLYTNADKSYTVKVSVVTKAIDNMAELKSIKVSGTTLDGYFVLTEDIGCDGTSFTLVGTWSDKLTTGFIGTFDGRGHVIDGYNGGDTGLFYCTGAKAVIKNVAFTNATGSRVLASTQIHGTTFENVFVSGSAQYFTANGFSAPKYKNVIFVSSNPNAVLFSEGNNNNNNGTMTLTNVFVVGSKIHGYYGGTMNEVNANTYATVEAMMAALSAEGELDKWTGSPYSIVDGKLFFAGKPLSFTEETLNTPVSLGDVEAAAKENVINVPAEITGNIIGISSGNTGRMTDGVEYENGKLTLSQKTVEGLAAGGWGETSLKIYTDEGKYYTVSVCLVTKAIGTFEELESIAVTGNTLDGYFVLTNDIYCEGKHVHLVGSWTNTKTTGFIGTFDGRGHIIDGFNGESNRGLFYCTGAGVIKNVAFTNATGTVVLANGEIHGTTFENIFVSGSARYLVANAWHSPTFKNVVFNSTFDGGDGRIYNEGNFGTLTINNLLVVGTRTHGYWGGTSNVTNANAVGDTTALITALSAEGELDKWAGSGFSVEDGKLLFWDRVVIG